MPLPTSRKHLLALLLGIALACDEGPSGVSTGNLLVTVSGLPVGSSADLVISGPGGYSQAVVASQTLTGLAPGTYTVAANNVTVGSAVYSGTPAAQTVSVGGSTATASVVYSTGAGSLSVTINGLGTSSDAAVTITGPDSYSRSISATQTLTSLIPGTYTVAAQNVVATGGTPHTPSPASQNVTVAAAGTATRGRHLCAAEQRCPQPSYCGPLPDPERTVLGRKRTTGQGPERVPPGFRGSQSHQHRGPGDASAYFQQLERAGYHHSDCGAARVGAHRRR